VFQEDYKLSLIGRLMIRKCIANTLGMNWEDIQLKRSPKGKPELMNTITKFPDFSFNISHQGEYTVLAASTESTVGVDIMKNVYPNNTTVPNFFKTMNRQFTDPEWRFINSFETEKSQLLAFYRLWSLKESYVKATGSGIGTNSANLMNFEIKTRTLQLGVPAVDSILHVDFDVRKWRFEEQLLDEDHIVTVARDVSKMAVECGKVQIFRMVDFDELLSGAKVLSEAEPWWWEEFDNKKTKASRMLQKQSVS